MRAPLAPFRLLLALAAALSGCTAASTRGTANSKSAADSFTPEEWKPEGAPRREVATPSEPAPCDGLDLELGRLRLSQRWSVTKHKCIVMVSSDDAMGKSRSYLFNSEGMLMTFSSFGNGPASTSTGARTHLLLPNIQRLRVESKGSRLLVHTTSGHVVTFDGVDGAVLGISGGEFRVDKTLNAQDGGAVLLRTDSGIVVDFGFMRGGSPHENPNGSATLSDSRGQECTVKNSDILSYTGTEPKVAVSSQAELSAFLASARGAKCGSLKTAAR